MNNSIVVLLSGKISSGKNTLGEMLLEGLGDKACAYAFAQPLKEMCRDAFKPVTDYLATLHPELAVIPENWFETKTQFTRLMLQTVGSGICRRLDNECWINLASKFIRDAETPIIIITDWRFPNEYLGISKAFHATTIRVNRSLSREADYHEHESETALDHGFRFDRVVANDGSLEDLRKKAHEICDHLILETML